MRGLPPPFWTRLTLSRPLRQAPAARRCTQGRLFGTEFWKGRFSRRHFGRMLGCPIQAVLWLEWDTRCPSIGFFERASVVPKAPFQATALEEVAGLLLVSTSPIRS